MMERELREIRMVGRRKVKGGKAKDGKVDLGGIREGGKEMWEDRVRRLERKYEWKKRGER